MGNEKPGVLLSGVDSLYLSYAGTLDPHWQERLEYYKGLAQSEVMAEKARAQVTLGGHLFEVKDRGQSRFAYVLQDNAFRIALSRGKAGALPLAYVQVGAEFLAHKGPEAAEVELRYIVDSLGHRDGDATVSRADVFVDFASAIAMDGWGPAAWVTRAHDIDRHYNKHKFTGWSIGKGAAVMARLYDKLREITVQSRKYYLLEMWLKAGWNPQVPVWRLEHQIRREALKELGLNTLLDLLGNLRSLWHYLTEDWLRLTVPNPGDGTQTRWPTHPLWIELQAVPFGLVEQPKLSRFRPERLPAEERLYRGSMGYLASYMASKGITEYDEGLGELLTGMRAYYDTEGRRDRKGFEGQLRDRVALKGRAFNTLRNAGIDLAEQSMFQRYAEAYRKAKDGDEDA